MRIFVSYASEQKHLAGRLIAHLDAEHHRVDAGTALLEPGQGFDARIRAAIDRADLFVFLLSPESTATGRYTLSELDYAATKWRPAKWHILPIVVSPVQRSQVPPALSPITWLEPTGELVADAVRHIAKLTRARRQLQLIRGLFLAAVAVACVAVPLSFMPRSAPTRAVDTRVQEARSGGSVPPASTPVPASPVGAAAAEDPPSASKLEHTASTKRPAEPPTSAIKRAKAIDRLEVLRAGSLCRPNLVRNSHDWYLTCQCPDTTVETPKDLFIDTVALSPQSPYEAAIARAQRKRWRCP